jgi:hypothetical protein
MDCYRVSGSFFQVNRFLAGKLVEVALASVGKARSICAGVGLFSIPMARRFGGDGSRVGRGRGAGPGLECGTGGANVTAMVESAAQYLFLAERAPEFVLLDRAHRYREGNRAPPE